MLSVFPYLLSWQMLSPFIIRVTLGVVVLLWAHKSLKKGSPTNDKAIGAIEGVAGILLTIGAWTQVAALVIAIDLVIRLWQKASSKNLFTDGVNYYFILFILSLSLLVTGAGAFSFDLPL